jgi:NAD(P)-dependent dehydrogenase (short-subunit alcohol dehydrogenase family)
MDLGFADATAVVAGGSKGMGRAAAECLAADGCRVAVLGRTQAALDDTVAVLQAAGSPDAVAYRVDLTRDDQVRAAVAAVGERWGRLNVLINAAGPLGATGALEQLDDAAWVRAFDEGTLSAVRCVRAALPWLRQAEWARIVNVAAHSVKRQSPTLIAYTAAKAAMTSMSKNLARTLGPEGILVNTVSPGTIMSAGLRGYLQRVAAQFGIDPDDPRDAHRVIAEQFHHPVDLARAGLPDEVGAVIAFVASRRNGYMTGANINVDGGSDFC